MSKILWIDDDGKDGIVDGHEIIAAKTCRAADQVLRRARDQLGGVVVDLILPQDGWGERVYRTPGVEMVKHVREVAGAKLPIAVYAIALTDDRRAAVKAAGAGMAYGKFDVPLDHVLRQLKKSGA